MCVYHAAVQALAGVGGENQGERSSQVVIAESDTHEEFGHSDLVGKSSARAGHDMESSLVLRDDLPDLHDPDDCWISPPDSGQSVTYADTLTAGFSPEIYQQKVLQNEEGHQTLPDTTRDASNLVFCPDVDDTSLDLSSPPVSSATSTLIKSQRSGLNSSSDKEPLAFASDFKLEHHNGADASSRDLHELAHLKESKIAGADTAPRVQPFKGIFPHLSKYRFCIVLASFCGAESAPAKASAL